MSENFGISEPSLRQLRELLDATAGLRRVWIFGSRNTGRARVNSDIDIAFDAPGIDADAASRFVLAIEDLPTLYRIDALHWQAISDPVLRSEVERDRQLFWEPASRPVEARHAI